MVGAPMQGSEFFELRPLAGSVANVHDPHLVCLHAIVNLVGIANDRKLVDACLIRHRRDKWKLLQQSDTPLNSGLHRLRTRRRALVQIVIDGCKIVTRPRRITNPHTPCRLKNSAISASLTNSPRLACSEPSRIAARVSSSSRTGSRNLETSDSNT